MVNVEEFREREESVELSDFKSLCMCHIDTAKDQLLKQFVFYLLPLVTAVQRWAWVGLAWLGFVC